jgi:hypothetical protein
MKIAFLRTSSHDIEAITSFKMQHYITEKMTNLRKEERNFTVKRLQDIDDNVLSGCLSKIRRESFRYCSCVKGRQKRKLKKGDFC